jgi:hypothetical protein
MPAGSTPPVVPTFQQAVEHLEENMRREDHPGAGRLGSGLLLAICLAAWSSAGVLAAAEQPHGPPTNSTERAIGRPFSKDLRDVIGVTHVAGKYRLTDEDFLNEGADQILALGSRVIKLYLKLSPEPNYPFNTRWPKVRSLVELADTPCYRAVFEKPFTTYILTTYSVGRPDHYWRDGVTDEQAREEEEQFYRLARHLLATYRGSGKTFVLQHWEGDWAIRGEFDPQIDPTPKAVAGMIRWLNARQRGVERARAEPGTAGVRVLHAAEVNFVKIAMKEGRPTVTDRVLPHTRVDLASYSAWDTQAEPAMLKEALDYIAAHTPQRGPFGGRNVYLGEFGLPENEYPRAKVEATIQEAIRTALDWGCAYVVYWQVYCNEARRLPVEGNGDVRGFWLIRPDGSKAWAWEELEKALRR